MASCLSSELHAELVATIRRHMKLFSPIPAELPERVTPIHGIRAVLFDVYVTLLVSKAGDVGTEAEASDRQVKESPDVRAVSEGG